jgi:hypothetical protein
MREKYLCTSSGVKDGKAYASLSRIVQGTKANGDRYCFIDDKSRKSEAEEISVGEVVEYESTRVKVPATATKN